MKKLKPKDYPSPYPDNRPHIFVKLSAKGRKESPLYRANENVKLLSEKSRIRALNEYRDRAKTRSLGLRVAGSILVNSVVPPVSTAHRSLDPGFDDACRCVWFNPFYAFDRWPVLTKVLSAQWQWYLKCWWLNRFILNEHQREQFLCGRLGKFFRAT